MTATCLLLGFVLSDELATEYYPNDRNPAFQTQNFTSSFVQALVSCGISVRLMSCPEVSNFPANPRWFFNFRRFSTGGASGFTLPFINVLLLKHLTRFIVSLFLIAFTMLGRRRPDVLIVHGVHSAFLLSAYILSFFGLKYVPVLTDPPGVVTRYDSWLTGLLKSLDSRVCRLLLSRASGSVSLAVGLHSLVPAGRPLLTVPGILRSDFEAAFAEPVAVRQAPTVFKVVYAGAISKKYAVDILVDAIESLQGRRVVLDLYGAGDFVPELKTLTALSSCVRFCGMVHPSLLEGIYRDADLLVNPRPVEFAEASVSFPSKLVEYAFTGVPVMTTALPSIPEELLEGFFLISSSTVDGIRSSILQFIDYPSDVRCGLALKARGYVSRELLISQVGRRLSRVIDRVCGG